MDAPPVIKTGITAESGITGTGKAPTDGITVETTIPQPASAVNTRNARGTMLPTAESSNRMLPTAEEELGIRSETNEGGKNDGTKKRDMETADGGKQQQAAADSVRNTGVSDRGRGRNSDKRSGGQDGVLAKGRSQRTTDTGGAAIERQNTGRSLQLQKVSSRELGLENGTDRRGLAVLPENAWDEELQQVAQRVRQETGGEVTFVLGSIEIESGNGEVSRVRGVYSNDGIIVQADNLRVSASKIADHEIFHNYADENPGLIQSVEQAIVERYGREKLDKIVQHKWDESHSHYVECASWVRRMLEM